MGFNRGLEAIAKEHEDQAALRKAARASDRFTWLRLKNEGDSVALRFMTPAHMMLELGVHNFYPTKPAPAGATKWSEGMSVVCRNDMQLMSMFEDYGDCYACENPATNRYGNIIKASPEVFAFAVVRLPVRGDGSDAMGGERLKDKIIGYADEVEEIDEIIDGKPTGRKIQRPRMVVVQQKMSNWFHGVKTAAMNDPDGEIRNRDFTFMRSGTGNETSYNPYACDKTPELAPGTEAWKRYDDLLAARKADLDEFVIALSSAEHFARWIDPTKSLDKEGKVIDVVPGGTVPGNTASSATAPAGAQQLSDEQKARLANLRKTI